MTPPVGTPASSIVPLPERSFYEQEFAGSAIVVALSAPDASTIEEVCRAATSLARVGGSLVLVVGVGEPAPEAGAGGSADLVAALGTQLGRAPKVLAGPRPDPGGGSVVDWMARLWLAVNDGPSVVVEVADGAESTVAAGLATAVRAVKLVITDPEGGWGEPPRSFADVLDSGQGYQEALAHRQGGRVVPAIERALAGGVTSANLCRAEDLDRELFTFDGTGTLFTSGGYLRLDRLRVDDLPAVEALVAQGVADGVLRSRDREEVARLAVTGLGARVLGSDHLSGIVSLDRETYRDDLVGEVACLYAVSRFSAAGAGGLLVDGLVEQAEAAGLRAVFAVTVSEAAAAFFERKGFVEVDHDELPAAKWDGYDPDRKARARAFLRNTSL